jgi:RNA polymerase sigma-70 factor (ECF subfamily)
VEAMGWQSAARMAGAIERDEPWTTEALFRQHVDDVARIVARLMGPHTSEADIDDLVQQVFIAADRALPKFRGDSKITTWLYGIASRVVLHNLRGRRRYKQMIERFEASHASPVASAATPDEAAAQRESLRLVWSALLRIKPKKRVVFVLFEVEGMTAPEIAAVLNISEASVRTRLKRARHEVMTRLEKTGATA